MILRCTATQAISANPKHAAEQVDTSSYQVTHKYQQIMEQFSTLHTSSKTSCHWQHKQISSVIYHVTRSSLNQNILDKMGHRQPPTPMQTNNVMADAVINGEVQPIRNKAMDMQFT
jgi:hypothetical protein